MAGSNNNQAGASVTAGAGAGASMTARVQPGEDTNVSRTDEDDGEKTERNNKMLQNKKPTEECTANTLVVDGKKAGKKRDAREPAEVHKKKQKVSACK